MELPSCLDEYDPDIVLNIDDRRELIKGLAEDGTKSIDDFIIKHSDDRRSGIAKLVQRLRRKLESQVKRTKERIERRFKSRRKKIQKEYDEYLDPISFDDSFETTTSSYIYQEIDSTLTDILSKDDILKLIINLDDEVEEERLTWWDRLRLAFRRFIKYLIDLFRRFGAWLRLKFGRSKKESQAMVSKKQVANILLQYPSGSQVWNNMDRKLGNALATNSKVKHSIDRALGSKTKGLGKGSQMSRVQNRLNGHGYDRQVRDLLKKRIKRALKREEARLANEFRRKRRRIKQLHKDKKHQDKINREHESRMSQLEKQKTEKISILKNKYKHEVHKSVKKSLVNELEDAGYIQKDKKADMKITTRLIDRFAEIVLSDELQKLPGKHSMIAGNLGTPHGIYEKKKLRMSAEISRMDIVDSIVNARLSHPRQRHIYDSDITTHTDVMSTISHVVLVFDKSGSMEENQRISAAKRAVLALYKAVKHRNQRNIVDFIAFDSTVHVMDILSAWQSSPSGFTNTSEALNTARQLIQRSNADNKIIYLITDGLPEAYSDKLTGKPRAGDLDKSLRFAVSEAKKLKKISSLKLTIILLEPKDALYTDAAKTIAKAASGSVIVTDPKELATEMLTDYIEV
jgi:uncharacterized protein with von Willebrand factor type A (vWA) domain